MHPIKGYEDFFTFKVTFQRNLPTFIDEAIPNLENINFLKKYILWVIKLFSIPLVDQNRNKLEKITKEQLRKYSVL